MTDFELEFPPGYDGYAWEVEAKGWLQDVIATIAGSRYRLTFYDPTSLAQDAKNELAASPVFFEQNLVVVPATTRECMIAAVADLVRSGRFRDLAPEEPPLER